MTGSKPGPGGAANRASGGSAQAEDGGMLTKAQVRACLAGEPTPVVPAWLFWFDGKFVRRHEDQVHQMRRRYVDDWVQVGGRLTSRPMEVDLAPGEFCDDWGCRFAAAADGVGAHPTRPIVGTVDQWTRYVAEGMPRLEEPAFSEPIRRTTAEHADHYVVAQFWRTFYERMYMLMGFEPLLMEIATDGELFTRMLADLRDFTLRGIEAIADTGADAVFLADDWGTQHRLQISPAMWRKHFRPAYAAMIDAAHARGLDVWLHSCGNITELIGEWIDLHLDVIAHLQPAAMDLPALAGAYRGQITFCGGLDVQRDLVTGTARSIRREVRTLMAAFDAHAGRYLATPANTIMPETPVQNVWALLEAIREYGGGE